MSVKTDVRADEIALLSQLQREHKLDDSLLLELDPLPGEPYFPSVSVPLSEEDGNGFVIASRVRMTMRRHHVPESALRLFFDNALSGSYDELIQTAMRWVDVS